MFSAQESAASFLEKVASSWQSRAMRRGWNQSCHVMDYRVAEPSKDCFSRQIVDDLSLIDDGSTQLGQDRRRAIATRKRTKLDEKNSSESTISNSNDVVTGTRAALLIRIRSSCAGRGPVSDFSLSLQFWKSTKVSPPGEVT